jgi:hypothetical protein
MHDVVTDSQDTTELCERCTVEIENSEIGNRCLITVGFTDFRFLGRSFTHSSTIWYPILSTVSIFKICFVFERTSDIIHNIQYCKCVFFYVTQLVTLFAPPEQSRMKSAVSMQR